MGIELNFTPGPKPMLKVPVFDLTDKEHAPDCLIFDVDGVLLDSSRSFPAMINSAVEVAWLRSGRTVDGPGYYDMLNWVFKKHRAFNNDNDIAWTLLCIAAARDKKSLKLGVPEPGTLINIIKHCGPDCREWIKSKGWDAFDYDEIADLCYALYRGDVGDGFYQLETPTLAMHWRDLPLPVGIYTGRNTWEWKLGKETIGWRDFPDDYIVNADSGVSKPSPIGLEVLCERLGTKRPLFFGDTESDARAYRAFGHGWFGAIGKMLGEEALNFRDVNEALYVLIGLDTGKK